MKLIKKYQYGKPIERQDNTRTNNRPPKRDINRELLYYYRGLINRALPKTYEEFKLDLINIGVLPEEGDYSVPVGHLGDGYRSVVVSPEVKYGPYDLPEMNVEGWGITQDPEYSDKEWKDLARKTILNDTKLPLSEASKYMWALNHPEFDIHPFMRHKAIPVLPGPWDRKLITDVTYQGYLPSDNPEYGGTGEITYGYEEPKNQIYKTKKYPPEDYNNKEHLYFWLERFYNRKNGLNKPSNPFIVLSK